MKLHPVFEPKNLSTSKVYLIDSVRYRYVRVDGDGRNIKYVFQPLLNQRKTSEVSLNSTKLSIKCQEVEGMVCEPPKEQTVVQMGFL